MQQLMGGGAGRLFPATRWTLIRSAQARPEIRRQALDTLLRDYWRPLYYLARRRGLDVAAAEDAVQGFVATLLARDFIVDLDATRGRLRGYLRTSFEHYLVNLHEREGAAKRGRGAAALPLDTVLAERLADPQVLSPEAAFDRAWAAEVLIRALRRLRADYEGGEESTAAKIVSRHFSVAQTAPSYEETAAEFGMTIAQLKSFLHRARLRFRRLVREEVADTVGGDDAEQEMRDLLAVLGR